MLLYQSPSQLQKKLSRITHKNRMQSDPLNKHLVLNTGHPFSVLVRSAGQECLEGYKPYKEYIGIFPLERSTLESEMLIQHCADRGFQGLPRIIIQNLTHGMLCQQRL